MANEFVIKNGLISKGDGQFTGSVFANNFIGDFTGSLLGSSSYSITASYALNGGGTSQTSSSWASSSISSSYASIAGVAYSISFTPANALSSSFASSSLTSSYLPNATYQITSAYASNSDQLDGNQGQFYQTASNLLSGVVPTGRLTGSYTITSSWSNNSLSASYFGSGTNNYFPLWGGNRLTSTSSLFQSASNICIETTTPYGILTVGATKYQDYLSENRYGIASINKISMVTGTGNHTGSNLRGFTSIVGENWGSGATGSGVYIAPFINQYQNLANYYGIYIDDILWDTTGAGTVTNDYYGIYQKSATAKNYFAGNVGIGYSGSTVKLRVKDPSNATKVIVGNDYLDGNTDNVLVSIQTNQTAGNYAGLYMAKMGNCGAYLTIASNGVNIGPSADGTTPGLFYGCAGTYINRLGINTNTPNKTLDVSGSISIPYTTNSNLGIIFKGTDRFIHDYYPRGSDGPYNTFVGTQAGNFTMATASLSYEGCYNSAFGFGALASVTSGHQNTAVGMYALTLNTSGSYNVAIGKSACTYNVGGSNNIGIGVSALSLNVNGNYNVAVGQAALSVNLASGNTAVGQSALQSNTTGYNNVSLGYNSMLLNVDGYHNTSIGVSSLYSNTSGYGNIAVGVGSQFLGKTGYSNVAIGNDSLRNNFGGIRNVSIGASSLLNNTGSYNTAIGDSALPNNTTAGLNTSVGVESGYYNTDGGQNTFLGAWAGYNPYNNIAQYRITSDTNMVLIGAAATKNNASTITNGIAIGYGAQVADSNQVVLGNTSITTTHIRGITYHNNYIYVAAPNSQSSTFIDQHYNGVWGHQLSHYNGTPYFYQRNSASWDVVNQISTNGATYFNGTGKVGIGTTSPQELLHVQGNISCSNVFGTVATASYVANVSVPNYYTLNVITASSGIIPIDLNAQENILYLTASAQVTFSLVSGSTAGKVQDTNVYIKNTSSGNVTVKFPSTWINLGGVWASTIVANKSGILVLRSIDNSIVVGTYNTQL